MSAPNATNQHDLKWDDNVAVGPDGQVITTSYGTGATHNVETRTLDGGATQTVETWTSPVKTTHTAHHHSATTRGSFGPGTQGVRASSRHQQAAARGMEYSQHGGHEYAGVTAGVEYGARAGGVQGVEYGSRGGGVQGVEYSARGGGVHYPGGVSGSYAGTSGVYASGIAGTGGIQLSGTTGYGGGYAHTLDVNRTKSRHINIEGDGSHGGYERRVRTGEVNDTRTHTTGHLSGTVYPIDIVETEVGSRKVSARQITSTRIESENQRVVNVRELEGTTKTREFGNNVRVRVPKKRVIEEVIEHVVIVPEVIRHEVYSSESMEVEEKVVEVEKVTIQEEEVEIPEIEEVEVIIEEEIVQWKERVVEVEKIINVDKEVVVDRYVDVEKVVEQEEHVDVDAPFLTAVPRKVDVAQDVPARKMVCGDVYVDVQQVVIEGDLKKRELLSPIPVEAEVTVEFALPVIMPREHKKKYPIYLPRFIEVPVARQFANREFVAENARGGAFNQLSAIEKLESLMATKEISLCEIENYAATHLKIDSGAKISAALDVNAQRQNLFQRWRELIRGGGASATANNWSGTYQSGAEFTAAGRSGHVIGNRSATVYGESAARGGTTLYGESAARGGGTVYGDSAARGGASSYVSSSRGTGGYTQTQTQGNYRSRAGNVVTGSSRVVTHNANPPSSYPSVR